MKRIVVFCGSSAGNNEAYTKASFELGKTLASRNIEVVYGGSKVGLMGAVADGALSVGGHVVGVLPRFLKIKEIEHTTVQEMILVDTMHERKMKMQELSDGIVTLPGGFGTMEEFFEVLTWGQLGLHQNPIGILNINGFYSALIQQLDFMVSEGFLNQENRDMLLIEGKISSLLDKMENYVAPKVPKWINKGAI